MTRKNIAAVYFTEELENEIQERALQHIFISKTRTREDVMKGIHCLWKKNCMNTRKKTARLYVRARVAAICVL